MNFFPRLVEFAAFAFCFGLLVLVLLMAAIAL